MSAHLQLSEYFWRLCFLVVAANGFEPPLSASLRLAIAAFLLDCRYLDLLKGRGKASVLRGNSACQRTSCRGGSANKDSHENCSQGRRQPTRFLLPAFSRGSGSAFADKVGVAYCRVRSWRQRLRARHLNSNMKLEPTMRRVRSSPCRAFFSGVVLASGRPCRLTLSGKADREKRTRFRRR